MKVLTHILIGLVWFATGSLRLPAEESPPAAEMPAVRLVPPWELPGPLVMVWPENLSRGRRMIPSTIELIQALPETLDVALASPRPPRIRWLEEIGRDMRYLPIPTIRSREIGKWAGTAAATAEGRLFNLRFPLPVQNVTPAERAALRDDFESSRQLGLLLYGDSRDDVPLRMGRLHMTHNGEGVALISNRVIADNQELSLIEIRKRLQQGAGLNAVLFVPVPASEPEGYIDGLVRFVAPRKLLVSEPVPGSEVAREQHQDLLRLLQQELNEDIDVIRVPRPSRYEASTGPESYLHLIQTRDALILPQFDTPEDRAVLTLLRRQIDTVEILSVGGNSLPSLRLNRIALWH